MAEKTDKGTLTVTVNDPYQVFHDATAYGPGEQVTAPAALARDWLAYGWVSEGSN